LKTALRGSTWPAYRLLFPAWSGTLPLSYFMLENLLEARIDSPHPTNSHRPDEDVNVYLAQLLATRLAPPVMDGVLVGADPLLLWPEELAASRRGLAEHYRVNGDHRLLALGLFDRGDLRRRGRRWGRSAEEGRRQDRENGAACYRCAHALLARGRPANPALIAILGKLADGFTEYVEVLQHLARRRFGLGARLTATDLQRLLEGPRSAPPDATT
jgi:hypothetical protein